MTGPELVAQVAQEIRIIRANALLFFRGDVLADFEADLIRSAHRRLVRSGDQPGQVTSAEWAVIDDAVAAMERAPRQDLTEMGLAA